MISWPNGCTQVFPRTHSSLLHWTENGKHLTGYAAEWTDLFLKHLHAKIRQIYLEKHGSSTLEHLSQAPAVPVVLPKGLALPTCPGTVLSGEDASLNCDTQPIHFERDNMNGQSSGFRANSQSAQRQLHEFLQTSFPPRKMFFPNTKYYCLSK